MARTILLTVHAEDLGPAKVELGSLRRKISDTKGVALSDVGGVICKFFLSRFSFARLTQSLHDSIATIPTSWPQEGMAALVMGELSRPHLKSFRDLIVADVTAALVQINEASTLI